MVGKLRKYVASDGSQRSFRGTYGYHVFCLTGNEWGVATSVMKGRLGEQEEGEASAKYQRHVGVGDTKDGGISAWLPIIDGLAFGTDAPPHPVSSIGHQVDDSLPGSCDCGTVKFHVTRPTNASAQPRNNFPDLMYAYGGMDESLLKNPSDEKWWLRDNRTKYLAGACACRSCRLISGFEIQTWSFIPRANIVFHVGARTVPLDVETLPARILHSYRSSPGVVREYCGTCGATVLWHNEERPDVVDVSVGLLSADEGAMAERWLPWWTGRVSFEEDAEKDQWSGKGRRAIMLVNALQEELKSSRENDVKDE